MGINVIKYTYNLIHKYVQATFFRSRMQVSHSYASRLFGLLICYNMWQIFILSNRVWERDRGALYFFSGVIMFVSIIIMIILQVYFNRKRAIEIQEEIKRRNFKGIKFISVSWLILTAVFFIIMVKVLYERK
jgi:uncharacterized membrane protein